MMHTALVVMASSLVILFLVNSSGCSCDMKNTKNSPQSMSHKNNGTHSCSCPHDNDDTKAPQAAQEANKQMKTSSGLMYIVTREAPAQAASPQKNKTVVVHYTGWLDEDGARGRKFDSSVDRGQPFEFVIGVGQVIPGWDEGVMGMKVGEKRHLIIPPHLGYGSRGAGSIIPGNATLHFDVELLGIK